MMTPKQCAQWVASVGASKVPAAVRTAIHTADARREMEDVAIAVVEDVVYNMFPQSMFKRKRTGMLLKSVEALKVENGVTIGFDPGISPSDDDHSLSYAMYMESGDGYLKRTVPETVPRPFADIWEDVVGELAQNRLLAALDRRIV